MCLWRGDVPEEEDTTKIVDFYRQARQEGFLSTTFWGGEPLLREDIFEILKECQRLGLVTGLITNGSRLPKYYVELSKLLDFLIVSIDIPSSEHDQLRGVRGMFERAVLGTQLIRSENPQVKVFINSVISTLNSPYVDGLVRFSKDLKISITFESVNRADPEFPRKEDSKPIDLRLPPAQEKAVFRKLRLLKREGYRINNSGSYLHMFETGRVRYRCHARKVSIRVEPNGDVTNCLDRGTPIGNVYRERLGDILRSQSLRQLQSGAENCSRCVDTGTIECSLFWNFKPEVVLNTFRLFLG